MYLHSNFGWVMAPNCEGEMRPYVRHRACGLHSFSENLPELSSQQNPSKLVFDCFRQTPRVVACFADGFYFFASLSISSSCKRSNAQACAPSDRYSGSEHNAIG
jgi:hypothetical protein